VRYYCDQCPKVLYERYEELEEHKKRVLANGDREAYLCSECRWGFRCEASWRKHYEDRHVSSRVRCSFQTGY
jgi:hypothetical protein